MHKNSQRISVWLKAVFKTDTTQQRKIHGINTFSNLALCVLGVLQGIHKHTVWSLLYEFQTTESEWYSLFTLCIVLYDAWQVKITVTGHCKNHCHTQKNDCLSAALEAELLLHWWPIPKVSYLPPQQAAVKTGLIKSWGDLLTAIPSQHVCFTHI